MTLQTLTSVKDAANMDTTAQYLVDIPDLEPHGEGETLEAFNVRSERGLKLRDEIFAAVDAKVEADAKPEDEKPGKVPPGQAKKANA